ncbi:hypothetical protein FACS1894184_16340 [Clostridia bacterium]|nr:hypothetical protein FACS1894184_16340 [Clostridia bacterium]
MPLQPDVTSLLLDSALGAVQFNIIRTTVNWVRGRPEPTQTQISCIGNIQPATPRELEQLPEGDRSHGAIVVRTPNPIYISDEEMGECISGADVRTSDELVWRGDRYKVLSAFPWLDYGWVEAYATKKG